MLQKMQAEIIYFAWSVLTGVSVALGGDGMSWIHRRHRRSKWVGILDLLYWFLMGVGMFLLCYHQNSGVLRGYAVVGNLLGYGIWRMITGLVEKGIARRRKTG